MAWFKILSYTPAQASGAGSLGGVGGGWTDVGTQWKLANLGGGPIDAVLQTAFGGSSPWAVAQLVRKSAPEAAQNVRIRARYQSNGTNSSPIANAPWVIARYATPGTDATHNSLIVRTGSFWTIANGATSGPQANGIASGYANGGWYDIEVTFVTNGAATTITEQTWNVADHVNGTFAGGSLITPAGGNAYTTSNYNGVSGATGIFFYQPGTSGNVAFYSTDTDVAATTLTLSPAVASAQTGAPTAFTIAVNGAQNGGAIALSDGSAGGVFSPASVALGAGIGATQTFTYSPARIGSITITSSSTALTGSPLSATATVNVSAGPATALAFSPSSQALVAGAVSGPFVVSVNGALSATTTVSLSDGGAGGAFAPLSLSLASGSNSTATVTYTPSAGASTGSVTLTASASGLTNATATATVAAQGTALAISPSSQTVSAGVASGNFTVSVTGGGLAGAKTVSLADGGAGGTFAPVSLTLAGGASPTTTFTYTPANGATGTKPLTATASGLTSASAAAVVSVATILTPGNTSVVASPYNWVTGVANSTTSDNSALRTWNTGAYLRAYVSGTTSVNIVFGPSTTAAAFIYQIDDGLPSVPTSCLNNGSYTVTLPDAGAHVVIFTLHSISQVAGRWAGTLAVTINGFQLGSGGQPGTAIRGARTLLIYGDSITEGTQSRDGSDGVTTSYAYLVGEAHRRQGWEYGIKGAGFSGYTVTVPSANGGQPPAWTASSDATSSWNKVDGSGLAGAAITTGAIGSASERFNLQPDLIIDAWGANDGLQNVADATVQAAVAGLFQRLRVAAPNAVIVTVIPFGGYKRASIQAAASASLDSKLLVVDPKTDSRMTATGYCGNLLTGATSGQNVHPWSLGSANLAALLLRQLDASYVPFATARAYGSAF